MIPFVLCQAIVVIIFLRIGVVDLGCRETQPEVKV